MSQKTLKMRIKHHVEKVVNWNPQTSKEGTPFRYIDLSSIDRDTKEIVEISEILPSEAPSRARQLVQTNDVLVATVRPNLNGVAVVPSILNGATASTGFCVLRPKKDKLDHRFLFHWVKNPLFVGDMVSKATGANYPAVSDKTIKESEIPLPPLEEQKRIAAILDKADGIRRKRQQAMAMADEFLRSVFLDMFGDPVQLSDGQDNVIALEEVTNKITYGFTCPMKHVTSELPILTAKNIYNGYIDFENVHYADPEQYAELTAKSKPNRGDILVTKDGTIGRTAIVETDDDFCINQSVALIQPRKNSVLPEYIEGYLNTKSMQKVMSGMGKGNALKHLQITELAKMCIYVPSKDKQMDYVNIRSEILKFRKKLSVTFEDASSLFSSAQQSFF